MDQPAVDLPLISLRRERRRWLQKLPHAIPALTLIGAGVNHLRNGEQGFGLALAVAELAVSVLLLRLLAKDIIASRRPHAVPHHSKIEWFDILAAGVLTAEALEHWHHTGHVQRPVVLTILLSLGLGLFHHQFAAFVGHRRSLRIDQEGIRVRSRFRRPALRPLAGRRAHRPRRGQGADRRARRRGTADRSRGHAERFRDPPGAARGKGAVEGSPTRLRPDQAGGVTKLVKREMSERIDLVQAACSAALNACAVPFRGLRRGFRASRKIAAAQRRLSAACGRTPRLKEGRGGSRISFFISRKAAAACGRVSAPRGKVSAPCGRSPQLKEGSSGSRKVSGSSRKLAAGQDTDTFHPVYRKEMETPMRFAVALLLVILLLGGSGCGLRQPAGLVVGGTHVVMQERALRQGLGSTPR